LPARTPAEAVQAYRARISRVPSCLTTAHVDIGGGYALSAAPQALIIAGSTQRQPQVLVDDAPLT